MWEWLWGLAQAVTTTPSSPPAVVETVECQPGYTYSDWEMTREEKKFEGTWVVAYKHYKRTRTDDCTGETKTERKVEGPFQLWPAVPHGYTESVSRPTGGTDVSGTPLRSSDYSGGPGPVQVGPANNRTSSPKVNGTVPTGAPLDITGFVILAGALAFAAVTRRFRPFFFTLNAQGEVLKPGPDPAGARAAENTGMTTDPRVEEPGVCPPVDPVATRTLDSLPQSGQWKPSRAELEWLQALFGIDEDGYGSLTREAVAGFQKRHSIDPDPNVMIGPKTYRALWEEHLNLVHEHWTAITEGRKPADLDRVLDSPMPPDLREEMSKLNDAYKAYWAAMEGRYQAILRRNPSLISGYEEQIDALQTAGLKVSDIPTLKDKYQPVIDALYQQAEKVKNDANDGEYAKLLAMLDAADNGEWAEIASAKATWGGRWDGFWSADKAERRLGEQVLSSLQPYVTPVTVVRLTPQDSATTSPTATITTPQSGTPESASSIPALTSPVPAPEEIDAQLAKYFSKVEDQLIIKHTMSEEGPGKFGANWGGVVYRDQKSGQLICDRQWINFGLISFAYPNGAAGGALKTLLSDPEEEKAFRSIAGSLLVDNPGGEVKEGWRHLLNDPANYTIAPKTKQELIDEFVAAIKSGQGRTHQDWMFKYLNTPATKQGVATGDMRDDWHSVLSEFLSRPASQATQLNSVRNQYFGAAVEAALDPKQFGLTTVRGVGFLFDVMVQNGGPTKAMIAKAATEEYQQASEMEKLEMLRETFRQGSTEWHRRDSVIKSTTLTDDPYPR